MMMCEKHVACITDIISEYKRFNGPYPVVFQKLSTTLAKFKCIGYVFIYLLGALTKLQKVTISFVISVHPSVCPSIRMEQWTGFQEILYLRIFFKYALKIQVLLKSEKNSGT
jgi:hypothetical protein